MEYAPNGDLGRFIKKGNELKKAFPEEIIWKYFMQICEGLQALHAAKIIHRDIKPMNIFVGDHDVVKVRSSLTAARLSPAHLRSQALHSTYDVQLSADKHQHVHGSACAGNCLPVDDNDTSTSHVFSKQYCARDAMCMLAAGVLRCCDCT